MKIRDKAGGPRGLRVEGMDEKVQFDAKGVATVKAELGKWLCQRFDAIVPVESKKKAKAKDGDA